MNIALLPNISRCSSSIINHEKNTQQQQQLSVATCCLATPLLHRAQSTIISYLIPAKLFSPSPHSGLSLLCKHSNFEVVTHLLLFIFFYRFGSCRMQKVNLNNNSGNLHATTPGVRRLFNNPSHDLSLRMLQCVTSPRSTLMNNHTTT